MLRKLTSRLSAFVRNQHGTTTVEFILVMPLIVFWIGGTLTFFNAFSEYTKSVKATYTVADILSRQTVIDDNYIDNMNRLFANFMKQSTNDVWLRVSSIAKVSDTLTVDWSTATGIHNPLAVADDIPTEIIPDLLDEESIILVESHTPFVPFLDYIGIDANTYISRVVVSPRFSSQLANTDG